MSVEELIGKLWEIVETWGPLALVIFGVFFLAILSMVIWVFSRSQPAPTPALLPSRTHPRESLQAWSGW